FYTEKLGFKLLEDTKLTASKRWVRVGPHDGSFALLLAKADGDKQEAAIGNQSGGRVFLFLQTDDFWSSYNSMKDKGVRFKETPRNEAYGTVAVFEDLYGNLWDLLELK
ncbi:MAG: VOC family protein, partial [Flavobacteriaceae bacterium]